MSEVTKNNYYKQLSVNSRMEIIDLCTCEEISWEVIEVYIEYCYIIECT